MHTKLITTYLVLGGYGEMGRITVHDLFETSRGNIIVAGRDGGAAKQFVRTFKSNRVRGEEVDVRDIKKLAALMKKCDVVINATQYTFNLHVMRACELARKPYLDLGGLFHMTKRQLKLHIRFKKKGMLAVLGCGSTPGITNVLARYGASLLDTVQEIHIRFADHDMSKAKSHFASPSCLRIGVPRCDIGAALPYSLATLFDEFTNPSAVLRKGKIHFVPAMTGRETEKFPSPIGKVTEYYTLHSELATFPSSFRIFGLRECSFKVSFPEDFIRDMQFLLALGTNSQKKIAFAQKLINQFIPKSKINDVEYIRVRMNGKRKGKTISLILDCITKSKAAWNASAGAYDTGVPPSIIAQMIIDGKITQRGVLPPELCIPPMYFFKELKKRGITIKKTASY